jgi:5-methylcytosine-specific restriction enzyme B
MKPKEALRRVTAEHIKKALAEINAIGNPKERRSVNWCLKIGNSSIRYPPKFVLSLAVKYAVGKPLSAAEHSGGESTHRYLRKALRNDPRYSIVRCPTGSNTFEY